jgi:hypothetical protein
LRLRFNSTPPGLRIRKKTKFKSKNRSVTPCETA